MYRLLTRIAGIFYLFFSLSASAQKVGVVLSGGGASGAAHVGVLKALEENSIPIDYITGTSSGALVGGLYAAGYSPDEIEQHLPAEGESYSPDAYNIYNWDKNSEKKSGESNG